MTSNYYLVFVASSLMAINFAIETIAYQLRCTGASLGASSLGYSLHVQISTFARILNFIALPILGWLIDKNIDFRIFITIPVIYSIVFILSCTFYLFIPNKSKISVKFYIFLVEKISKVKLDKVNSYTLDNDELDYVNYEMMNKLFILGVFSTFFTTLGSMIPLIIASYANDSRATILQMSPLFTGIGTLISVIFFDPRVSILIKDNSNNSYIMNVIIKARMFGVAIIGFLSLFILFLIL